MMLFSPGVILAIIVIFAFWRLVVPQRYRAPFMTAVCAVFILTQGAPAASVRFFYLGVTLYILLMGHRAGKFLSGKPAADTKGYLRNRVILILLPLIFFKLLGAVFPTSLVRNLGMTRPELDLRFLAPLGISYLCFRVIAYLIEVRRGSIKPEPFHRYFFYVTFWPTLLAGPIERPGDFFPQVGRGPRPRRERREDLAVGVSRVAVGAVKTLLLGGIFSRMAAPILGLGTQAGAGSFFTISVGGLWLSVVAYYFHIYFDFSGYSDIAIGLARIFGYRIRENFDWPILAGNIADFWRRWHISLTGWIRDYVYFPLGGSRHGRKNAVRNTFVAMILVGLWHGLALHYFLFGAYHALLLVIYRQWRKEWRSRWGIPKNGFTALVGWLLTFIAINLGWVIFVLPAREAFFVYMKLFGLLFTGMGVD